MATETVYAAIHNGNPTSDLIAIQYLETLAEVANGKATKIFLPTEVTALLGAFGGMKEMLETQGASSARRPPARPRRPASS
jgi:hypothetical protein